MPPTVNDVISVQREQWSALLLAEHVAGPVLNCAHPTTDGFGNCVVVSQPPSAGVGNSASASVTGQAAATEAASDPVSFAFRFVD